MKQKRRSFKMKVMLPAAAIFLIAAMIIAAINVRQLALTVGDKNNANMTLFIDNIMAEYAHLDAILGTAKKILNEKHFAIAVAVDESLAAASYNLASEQLQRIADELDIVELNIANSDGILTVSNDVSLIGFDYKSDNATGKYMNLVNGTASFICEEPRLSVVGDGLYGSMNHYIGIPCSNGKGFVQIGFNADVIGSLQNEINIKKILHETRIGENGYGMVLSNGKVSISPNDALAGIDVTGESWYETVSSGEGFAWIDFFGEYSYAGYKNANGITVLALVPHSDYYMEFSRTIIETAVSVAIAVIIMAAVICLVLNRRLSPIKDLVAGLEKIGNGDFETRLEGSYNDEFDEIKDAVNHMMENLRTNIERREQAEYESVIDALTGLRNRRYLDENLGHLMKGLSRSGSSLSVMMIDIDYFKKYNDTYGHTEGDKCLKAVAEVLHNNITRDSDSVVRYGGEEFAVIMPHTDGSGACDVAEKMLRDVRNLKIPHAGSSIAPYVTISIGIATGKVDYTQSGDDYIRRADEMLYKSKQEGRDRYSFISMYRFKKLKTA